MKHQANGETHPRSIGSIGFSTPDREEDLESAMWFFDESFRESGFDAGLESALTSLLVNPNFLFRIEDAIRAVRKPAMTLRDQRYGTGIAIVLFSCGAAFPTIDF